jgi:hypothetical protein
LIDLYEWPVQGLAPCRKISFGETSMNVRQFLDEYPILYSDQPKRTAEDALKEGDDLCFLKTDAGLIAVNRKTGCIFRNKKSPDKDSV